MSKPIRCRLYLHFRVGQFDWGVFPSLKAARQYIRECNCNATIVRLRDGEDGNKEESK